MGFGAMCVWETAFFSRRYVKTRCRQNELPVVKLGHVVPDLHIEISLFKRMLLLLVTDGVYPTSTSARVLIAWRRKKGKAFSANEACVRRKYSPS